MKRILKNPRVLAVLGLLALVALAAFWPRSVAVDVAPVRRGSLLVTVDEEGETRVHDRFVISAPVAGRVLRIELEPGDPVTHGQTVLATFQPSDPAPLDARSRAEAEASVKAADAALGRARAERERSAAAASLARSELGRQRDLAASGIVSEELLETAESSSRSSEEALRAADFGVANASWTLAAARARLLSVSQGTKGSPVVILSPIDGVVLKRLRESEAVVPAGEPLVELGDPHGLEIVADFLSSDAVRIHAGDPVRVERWGGDHDLGGRVRRVEPSGFLKISALGVEEQRVNVIVDFTDPLEAWARLGDGYRVELRVVTWQSEDVLQVPISGLFRQGESWAVFAVEGGRARIRTVTVGHRNELEAQILSGLTEGSRVIVHPSDSLRDGSRITSRAS